MTTTPESAMSDCSRWSGGFYEQMQERGGLSVLEILGLLDDYLERIEGGEPQ